MVTDAIYCPGTYLIVLVVKSFLQQYVITQSSCYICRLQPNKHASLLKCNNTFYIILF